MDVQCQSTIAQYLETETEENGGKVMVEDWVKTRAGAAEEAVAEEGGLKSTKRDPVVAYNGGAGLSSVRCPSLGERLLDRGAQAG